MMIHQRIGDTVRIDMSIAEWEHLLLMLGYAAGLAGREDPKRFWKFIQLANDLNSGNPEFQPYEIPKTERKHARSLP